MIKRTLRRNNNKKPPPTSYFPSCCPSSPLGFTQFHTFLSLWHCLLLVSRIPLEARGCFQWKLTEEEVSWILKSFDDNVKLDGSKRPIMHLVWEKLRSFLDIRVSTWELSLKVQSEKRQGFINSPAYGAVYSLLTCYLGFDYSFLL